VTAAERPKKPEIEVDFRGGRIPRSEYEALSPWQRMRERTPSLLAPLSVLVGWVYVLIYLFGGPAVG
jgi:hypothetical protein